MKTDLYGGMLGSSPRVRGTVIIANRVLVNYRIIPACAGNSGRKDVLAIGTWDHPRVCGEQQYQVVPNSSNFGSSPRVRGTVNLLY